RILSVERGPRMHCHRSATGPAERRSAWGMHWVSWGKPATSLRHAGRVPTKVQHVAEIDKEAFAAAVVHDMRAPLNACLMSLSLIELKASQPAEVLKSVEVLRRNLERQALLIDDLADALQIVGGGVELELEAADLVEIAKRAIESAGPVTGVEIGWATEPGPCPIDADSERLARAIGALLEIVAAG